MPELQKLIDDLLAKLPEAQRAPARVLLLGYGSKFFDLAKEDAWDYLHRLMQGDISVVLELDQSLSDAEFLARVKANTAAWANVAEYNKIREQVMVEAALRLASIVFAILAALVGL